MFALNKLSLPDYHVPLGHCVHDCPLIDLSLLQSAWKRIENGLGVRQFCKSLNVFFLASTESQKSGAPGKKLDHSVVKYVLFSFFLLSQ